MSKSLKLLRTSTILVASAILILDPKTASSGVKEGINLCLEAVIPALFPFLFLSGMLCHILYSIQMGILRPLGKICRMPPGSEGILLTGLIGGYPVGATLIANAYKDGCLSKNDSKRMLGFCNQAGPAFIFGMLGPISSSTSLPWLIWGLQILSAIITAFLLPGTPDNLSTKRKTEIPKPADALSSAIRTMATICGWVVIFRVILVFLRRWFLWLLPVPIQVLLTGFLEISNGCSSLSGLEHPGICIIISGCILSFGGICVGMQTLSVCKELGSGFYFPGKFLQCCINCLFSSIISLQIFPKASEIIPAQLPILAFAAVTGIVIILQRKKVIAFLGRILYTRGSYHLERG